MAAKNMKGLGTGLGVLFGQDEENEKDSQLLTLPISKVEPRLEQPREYFDQEALQELAERSTGRQLMLSLVRSSTMSAAPQALEERRMGPWVLLVVRPRSGIYRLHRGPRLRSDTWTR